MEECDAEFDALLVAPPNMAERREAEARRLAWLASEEGQAVLKKKEEAEKEKVRREREAYVRAAREAADFARWRVQRNRARGIIPPVHVGRDPEVREEGG